MDLATVSGDNVFHSGRGGHGGFTLSQAAQAGRVTRAAYEAAKGLYNEYKSQKRTYSQGPGDSRGNHRVMNTPATGTLEKPVIPRYLPVNFPTQHVIKQRFCEAFMMRSITTAAGTAAPAYVIFNTNSTFGMLNAAAGMFSNAGANVFTHNQPNQRDNWAAQYQTYRVDQFDYNITFVNTSTGNPILTAPAFVNGQAINDVIITTMKTLTATDITACRGSQLWEQKHNNQIICESAGKGISKKIISGSIRPEEFEVDSAVPGQDTMWTAVGASPAITRLYGIMIEPLNPTNTVALLPEVGVNVFVEITLHVHYTSYSATLRQAIS